MTISLLYWVIWVYWGLDFVRILSYHLCIFHICWWNFLLVFPAYGCRPKAEPRKSLAFSLVRERDCLFFFFSIIFLSFFFETHNILTFKLMWTCFLETLSHNCRSIANPVNPMLGYFWHDTCVIWINWENNWWEWLDCCRFHWQNFSLQICIFYVSLYRLCWLWFCKVWWVIFSMWFRELVVYGASSWKN